MRKALNWTVVVAALGYFVDVFDLTIFAVVRVASLKELGITDPAEITKYGMMLINLQAAGMLAGGLMWGIWGDKRGRLSVLFGSIILYSAANIMNAFVTDVTQYGVLRFIAGVGLAGELGAAITLVSETMSKEDRGYGTAIIATVGLMGAVVASLIGQMWHWQTAYIVGGCMGFLLLLARVKMVDSGMFNRVEKSAPRGDPRLLLSGGRFMKYVHCIFVGMPIYFSYGILFAFAPELAAALKIEGITAGNALLYGGTGLAIGDLLSGLLSQYLKSRKRAVLISLVAGFIFSLVYVNATGVSPAVFYSICFALGLAAGYWAVLVTVAAEQFGTNIRATVATTVPNVVRSVVIPLSLIFSALKGPVGTMPAILAITLVVYGLSVWSLSRLRETYGKDLDYLETRSQVNNVKVIVPASEAVEVELKDA